MQIELVELIEQLRAELTEAVKSGGEKELQFALGAVDVELTVAVEKSGTTGTKFKFWVVEAGLDGKLGSTSTQKIKLTLEPQMRTQPGRKPYIAGSEFQNEQ